MVGWSRTKTVGDASLAVFLCTRTQKGNMQPELPRPAREQGKMNLPCSIILPAGRMEYGSEKIRKQKEKALRVYVR